MASAFDLFADDEWIAFDRALPKSGDDPIRLVVNSLMNAYNEASHARSSLRAAVTRLEAERDAAWERLSESEMSIVGIVSAELKEGLRPTVVEAHALIDIIARAYKITAERPEVKRDGSAASGAVPGAAGSGTGGE